MLKIGFIPLGSFDRGISEARTVLSQSFQECVRVLNVFETSALIAGVECSIAPIWSEVRFIPKRHQSEHAYFDAHLARRMIALYEMQLLESFENPER